MDIIYILGAVGVGEITAKYVLVLITLQSGFAGRREEILNNEVVMDEEHVKHLSLNYVGDHSFRLKLLAQQEHVEPPEVHPHRGDVLEKVGVRPLPGQGLVPVDRDLEVRVVGGEHAVLGLHHQTQPALLVGGDGDGLAQGPVPLHQVSQLLQFWQTDGDVELRQSRLPVLGPHPPGQDHHRDVVNTVAVPQSWTDVHVKCQVGNLLLPHQLDLHTAWVAGLQGGEGLGHLVGDELEVDLVLIRTDALDVVLVEVAVLAYLAPDGGSTTGRLVTQNEENLTINDQIRNFYKTEKQP